MKDKGIPKALEVFEKIWREERIQKGIDITALELKEWVYDWFATAWVLSDIKWEKLGVNVEVKEDMFPMLLKRDDGKIFLFRTYRSFLWRFVTRPWTYFQDYRWTHMLILPKDK